MRRLTAVGVGIGLVAAAVAAGCGGDDGAAGDALPEAPRCAIAAPARGALHVDGTRIVDDAGRTVSLRGVNAGARSKFAPYAPFDFTDDGSGAGYQAALDAYLDRAAAWGIDVLRVPLSWQALEPTPGTWDDGYLDRYVALLEGAWARGLWTIVDFHQDVYADPFCGDGFPRWTLADPGPAQRDCADWFQGYDHADVQAAFDAFWADDGGVRTAFVAMWAHVLDRVRDTAGVVGYEPINEPHGGSANAATWAATTLADFYGDMAALVAAHDPGALTFVDTTGVDGITSDTSLTRPAGDGIVLAPHSYDIGALFGGSVHPDVAGRLAPWAALGDAWGVPVLIGEMGIRVDNPEAAVHLRRHLDAMDALGLHGTWWEYSVSTELWNGEDLSIVGGDGADTVMVAELARPFVRAVDGAVDATSWDPDARRFAVTWTPAGDAPAELSLPDRLGEVRIGARGACVEVDAAARVVRVQPDAGATSVAVTIEPAR